MADPLTILGLPGSLRKGSFNRATLVTAQELAPPGVAIEILDLGTLPLYSPEYEADLPAVGRALRARIRAADAILFATPEYNYSVPAVLKNAVEWGSRPRAENSWRGKPVAVMGTSPSRVGTARAQTHLRQIWLDLEVFPVPGDEVFIGQARQKFDAAGRLVDEESRGKIADLVARLARWVPRVRALTV